MPSEVMPPHRGEPVIKPNRPPSSGCTTCGNAHQHATWCKERERTIRRPNWTEYGLAMATAAATRADCTRRQVGCVIMRPDHSIVATGYNGGPPGGKSCIKGECPRGRLSAEEVAPGSSYDTGAGACIALHAEQNALLRASWDEMEGSTLYVTHQPCDGCFRMVLGTPLSRVVWPTGEYLKVGNARWEHRSPHGSFERWIAV